MTLQQIELIFIIYIFIIGIVIGSYLNVCIYRLPKRIPTSKGRSFCPNCNHQLHAIDLVPVFSYFLLNKKCRYCNLKISLRYPVIELLTGILFVLVYKQFGLSLLTLSCLFITAILIVVSMIDYDTMEIHDRMHIFLILASLPILFLSKKGISYHLLGSLIISIPLLILLIITRGGIGGGDVKLMAACGLFLGPTNTVLAMMLGSIIGAVIALVLIFTKQKSRKDMIPFGPFLSLGIYISMLYGNQLIHWYLNLL